MEVNPRFVVLLVVERVQGQANGKTFIQKLCYFIQRLNDWPLGFRAHYYGPYSDTVSSELSSLTSGGLLSESRCGSGVAGPDGWEIARFDYALTEAGKRAVAQLEHSDPEGVKRVRAAIQQVVEAGARNYVDMSFAAKTDWILQSEQGAMTFEGIASAAKRFNWKVQGTDVQEAASFLGKLGLVAVKG